MKYPPARKSIQRWIEVVANARWSSLAEVKSTFSSADLVPPNVVFNVGGNKYRLITLINFALQIVQVERALTHEQYSDWRPKKKEKK